MTETKNVLVLGAHPDDETGCAGTIARFAREGACIDLVTFSSCQDLNGPSLIDEWTNSSFRLGMATHTMFDVPNRRFPQYRQDVLDVLDDRRGQYDLVLCPSTLDIHQDHATVALEARRVFKGTKVLGYELVPNQVATTDNRAYVGLTHADLYAKLDAAAMYKSQKDETYMSREYLEGLARVRGVQSETEYAEAFEVIRWVL